MKLTQAQQTAVHSLNKTLKEWKGAVLRGEEGVGKTIIAASVAQNYSRVLYIGEAKAKKDVEAKLAQYQAEAGLMTDHISCYSYHAFADRSKLSNIDINKKDLIIFDECHNLRNWSAKWTERAVMTGRNTKKLFMSGTPMIKSPKDFIYTLRLCGLWSKMSIPEWKEHFYNAKPSPFNKNALELGEFRFQSEFQASVDLVTHTIKHTDNDADMPDTKIETIICPGSYTPPASITKETATSLEAGLKKAPFVANYIQTELREKNIHTALILTHFHDTAKVLGSKMGIEPTLDKNKLRKALHEAEKKGGYILTTLGLTSLLI